LPAGRAAKASAGVATAYVLPSTPPLTGRTPLADAPDLGGSLGKGDGGDRRQVHRAAAGVGDDQAGDVADLRLAVLERAHPDVDLSVALLEARRHRPLDLGADGVGRIAEREAEASELVAVEADLDLGVAEAGRRVEVDEAFGSLERGLDPAGRRVEVVKLVREDLDLDRGAEGEKGRAAELEAQTLDTVEAGAQPVDYRRFLLGRGAGAHQDLDLGAVLALGAGRGQRQAGTTGNGRPGLTPRPSSSLAVAGRGRGLSGVPSGSRMRSQLTLSKGDEVDDDQEGGAGQANGQDQHQR
jgi:hypothetical protein